MRICVDLCDFSFHLAFEVVPLCYNRLVVTSLG